MWQLAVVIRMVHSAALSGRAMLTSLPEGVVEMIVDHLYGNDKVDLLACPFTAKEAVSLFGAYRTALACRLTWQ